MIRKRNSLLVIGILLSLYACKKDGAKIDVPTITSYKTADVAYMGDSIPVSITAAGEYPLNTIKITFSRDGQRIAENIIPINKSGTYGNKMLVPFVKDIDDGPAEMQIMVKNKDFDYATISIPIQITRPKFPYLTLKTAYGDYKMLPVDGEPYKYAVTEAFPATKLPALIEAPAYGDNGNSFLFGGSTIKAYATNQDSIPFQKVVPSGTPFTVTFDTRSFVGEPFLIPSFGGIEFPAYTDNTTVIESDFTQNQTIAIDGILDIESWWIDPSFLNNNGDGTYKFRATTGTYRVAADKALKYFKIEPMDGDALADFNPVTHSGGVYINGGVGDLAGSAPLGRLGIPSINSNPSLWDANNNIAMAPLGDGIYQIKLIAGTTLFQSNVSGSTVGVSFYQNSRLKTNPLAFTLVQSLYGSPGTPHDYAANGDGNSATIGTARFNLKPASANSVGQMIATGSNRSLGNGRTYVFTVDTKVSPAAVSISIE